MVKEFDEKSCGIVVYRVKDGIILYLLLHYPSGHWDLPKGHVETNETEHQTAARELLEETGISDIQFIDGFREEISYQYRRNKKISDKQVVFFLGKTKLEEIKLSHEHHGFKWLPYEAAYNKLTFDNAKNLVKKANIVLAKQNVFAEQNSSCYNDRNENQI